MKNNLHKKILVVDDESEMRVALETTLKREGYQPVCVEDGKKAWERIQNETFDLIVSDVKMPKMDGVELLRAVKQHSPKTIVIMMTAYGDIDNAVETMKVGAFDYLLKPFSAEILISSVNRAFMNEPDNHLRSTAITKPTVKIVPEREIITCNPEMLKLLKFAENIAYSKSTVLIIGETGTGKELFAKLIHQCSPRANKSFIPINCAALPEGLLETEMFGHEKGAFTGADYRKEGKFELAHKGTLLLDEVTEMSLPPHTYIEKGLYLCGPETLLRRAQDLPEEVNSAIIIAHNPDLHILTMDLGARGGENLAALAHGFPTAGLARLEFATDSWSEISGSNDILLVDFVSPRILANHDAMAGGLEAEK